MACDASSLLNLLATGHAPRILGARKLLLSPKVVSEMLYLYSDEHRTSKVQIDGALLKREGVDVDRATLTGAEVALAARYATEMDDGEAQTLAVAKERGIAVLSDDNAVMRAAPRDGVPLISSLDLLHRWSTDASTQTAEVVAAAISMRLRANYAPPRGHALRSWYVGLSATQ